MRAGLARRHCAAVCRAVEGTSAADVLPARAQFLQMLGILAGKWPHTLGIRPGGSTRAVSENEQARLAAILLAFRRFLERHLFGDRLEEFRGARTRRNRSPSGRGPAPFRIRILDNSLPSPMMSGWTGSAARMTGSSASALTDPNMATLLPPESMTAQVAAFDPALVTEDTDNAWYEKGQGRLAPFEGLTAPAYDDTAGYSWCKAPRYGGKPFEVGALARQVVNGHPLLIDLVRKGGGNVHSRVVARMTELAATVIALEKWVAALEPEGPFSVPDRDPKTGQRHRTDGSGARFTRPLADVRDGRIANYQIIAPTTWNFSPRDAGGWTRSARTGADWPAGRGAGRPVLVQHIVRSFDPCMVCTVH